MKPPCEMVVWYIIPAIRSELAKDLLKLGMKQKKISELMDITQPAVSQYLTDKRDILDYDIDTRPLKRDLNDLFSKYYGVELNRFEGVIDDLLTLMQRYKVKLPNDLVLMARGISMVENIGQHLDSTLT